MTSLRIEVAALTEGFAGNVLSLLILYKSRKRGQRGYKLDAGL